MKTIAAQHDDGFDHVSIIVERWRWRSDLCLFWPRQDLIVSEFGFLYNFVVV